MDGKPMTLEQAKDIVEAFYGAATQYEQALQEIAENQEHRIAWLERELADQQRRIVMLEKAVARLPR
jgi:predicted RNase H-like nuclease (RuvC/YqgF family)